MFEKYGKMDRLSKAEKEKRKALGRAARKLPKEQRLLFSYQAKKIQEAVFEKSYQSERWTSQDAYEVINSLLNHPEAKKYL